MPGDSWNTYLLVALVVLAVVVAWYLVRRSGVRPADVGGGAAPPLLDRGWQFYSRPTELEPPGTIFRIDAERRRYIVDTVPVQTQVGVEAFGKHQESVDASLGVVARFFGAKGVNAKLGGGKTEKLVFELQDVAREVAEDADLDAALAPVLRELKYRADNRYFVIRESRRAKSISHHLTRSQVTDLGGEVSVGEAVKLEGTVFEKKADGEYVLEKAFDPALRIMFLPEEILPVDRGLAPQHKSAGPEAVEEGLTLDRVPVREPLLWEEAEDVPA
jgi:hypothetical protein